MNKYTKHLNDFGLSPGQLEAKYADKGEHPHFTREEWNIAYWTWVRHHLERAEDALSVRTTSSWEPLMGWTLAIALGVVFAAMLVYWGSA